MTKAAIVLVGLLALSTGNVAAQEPPPRDSVPRSMLDRAARSNWYLRTVTVDAPQDTIAGRIRMTSGRYRIGDEWVERGAIQSLDRRIEEGSGALIGGLIGAIVAGAAAEGMSRWNRPDDGSTNFFALGLGAGAGAMFGMFTGHAVHPGRVYWRSIWPE
ncbi:MAG TPA: hypothetical protein VK912_11410 [Longimicrobiales bacterium]|nr:hypothetical protein [Longimicrobiales bacterium]